MKNNILTLNKGCLSVKDKQGRLCSITLSSALFIDTDMEKKCTKCGEIKSLSEFHKTKALKSGITSQCKVCRCKKNRELFLLKKNDPIWLEWERKRCRLKYYKSKDSDSNFMIIHRKRGYKSYKKNKDKGIVNEKYAEISKAESLSRCIKTPVNKIKHHWNYNSDFWLDVIFMSYSTHNRIHHWMRYDFENKIFISKESNQPLDTKKKHIEFIEHIIETKYHEGRSNY